MIVVEVEKLQEKLNNIVSPKNLGIMAGKEVEVQTGVFIKLVGKLDFSVASYTDGIQINFKIKPQVRVEKIITLYGELTSAKITKNGVYLDIDGLPDVFLKPVS